MEYFGISFTAGFIYSEEILTNLFSANFIFIKKIFPNFYLSIRPIIKKLKY